MPKAPAETLDAFLHRQQASTLAAVLLELADIEETVKERLLRLQLARRGQMFLILNGALWPTILPLFPSSRYAEMTLDPVMDFYRLCRSGAITLNGGLLPAGAQKAAIAYFQGQNGHPSTVAQMHARMQAMTMRGSCAKGTFFMKINMAILSELERPRRFSSPISGDRWEPRATLTNCLVGRPSCQTSLRSDPGRVKKRLLTPSLPRSCPLASACAWVRRRANQKA